MKKEPGKHRPGTDKTDKQIKEKEDPPKAA